MTTATATTDVDVRTLRQEQAKLRTRLRRLRRTLRGEMALEFALDAVGVAVLIGTVLVGLDAWLRLGLKAREILLGISLAGIAVALIYRAIPRVKAASLDDLSLAMTLDRIRPGTGQQAADVLQLPAQLDDPRLAASPAFVRLAVQRASESLDAADWNAYWNRGRTATRTLGLLALLGVPLGFALLAPAAARLSVARWLRGSNERWPQRTYLTVTGLGDGNGLLAPRDEPFAVEVRADLPGIWERGSDWFLPGRGEPLWLREKPRGPAIPRNVRLREHAADGSVRDALMTAVAPGRFRHELPPSSINSTFELVGGDDWLGPIGIKRVDRPSLQATKIRVRDPGDPNAQFRAVDDSTQHLIFLPDTEVEATFVGNEPIARTRLEIHPGDVPTPSRVGPDAFAARWTLREATTVEVELTSKRTGLSSKPSFLSLSLLKDREPRVTLRAQGVTGHVTPVATIPLTVAATDDLGLAAIRLQIERTTHEEGKTEPTTVKQTVALPLASDGGKAVLDHQARHDVDLQTIHPPVGTILRLQAEAEDRCARGVQVGRSGVVHLQVVSPDELFYEILVRQRAERAKFLAALEAAEKQTPLLAGSPPPADYVNVTRGLHTGTRHLDQIASRIADTLQEMKLNQIGSPKSHRLLQDGVIDPIRALNNGPVTELQSTLQALSGNGPKGQDDAEKARRQHAEVVARMRVILDQMSQWESFVDVVNQVAEVIKIQQKVLKATENARESRTQEVFDENKP